MKITKFGHSCLLLEEGIARILLDPGEYSDIPRVSGLSAILITHEHRDHISIPKLKTILENNEGGEIITHEGVGELLDTAGIAYRYLGHEEGININGVAIESFGVNHEVIHETVPIVRNTGFLIAKRFFYPGDRLYNPHVPVEILGLPVAAPWATIGYLADYAKEINPKKVIPMHDGMLKQGDILTNGPTRKLLKKILEPLGIEYVDMEEGSVWEG